MTSKLMKNMVTIYCSAYNHEHFIKDALEGIIIQNASFNYRAIVHDDASQDKTPQLIQEYELMYPSKITGIYQEVNQYSQGIDIFHEHFLPHVNSKYIAICEGDDYWVDPNKLASQVEYMEKWEDCSLCVCAARFVDEHNKEVTYPQTKGDRDFSTREIIAAGGGGLFHTCSYLFRTELVRSYPKFLSAHGFMDYPLAIYLSLLGRVHYLDKTMVVHRANVPGSWTRGVRGDPMKLSRHYEELNKMLTEVSEYTSGEYDDVIAPLIERNLFNRYIVNNDRKKARELAAGKYYRDLHIKDKMYLIKTSIMKKIGSIL